MTTTAAQQVTIDNAVDDNIFSPMRFISKADDYQVYGALLPDKKESSTTDRSKGIDLLSEAALLDEAQVLDEPKANSVDTHKGTSLKLGVLDVSKADSLESELIPTDDETNDETNDVDKEEYERISKELYGDVNVKLTDAEHNDEEKGDADMTYAVHVQVEQIQEQTTGVQEESCPEMASIQGQYAEQATTTTTPIVHNATTEVPLLSSSHFVSSTYTNAFLNLKNLHSTKTDVVSILDINVQHEVLCTSPLLAIYVSIIPKHTVFHPSETVITASATTITSFIFSLFPTLQQSIPIPTLINTKATTSTFEVPESKTLFALHQRITNLEKDVKELKNVDNSTTVISTIKSEVPNAIKEYLGSSLDDARYMMIQKHSADIIKEHFVPAEIVERLKQQYAPQKNFDYAKHDDVEFDNTDMPMDHGEDLGKTDEQPNDEAIPKNYCVKAVEWYGYGHLEEIAVKRSDEKLYTFKEGDFKRLHLNNIEDMLLLVVQNKIHNLDRNVVVHLAGFMRADELYKFSDDTLILVHNTLDLMHHELHLRYNTTMGKRLWTRLNQQRIRIMIKSINQKLLDRQIMRILEKFVGGRDHGEDLRLLQQTL
uniref:Uncharacterized protein n=1 Tax=Tanacetum cinerariifolium TaxID=118510 RepID=A0A6L2L2H9_TANCI|nr:hypothetical protein CTI12_AA475510 [Tanacetum cinerariifolium]